MRCFRSIENSNPNPHQATEHLRSPFAMCCPPADAAGVGGRQHAVSRAGENFSPLPGRTILSLAGGYKLGNGSRGEASRETSLPLLVFERHSRRTETSWSLSSRTGNGRFGRSRGLTETGHSPVPFRSLTQHLMESSRPTCDSGMIENPPTRTLRPRAAPRGLGSTAETQTLAPADSGHARNRRSHPAWALRGAGNQGCSSLLETIDTPHWGCTE